MWKNYFKVSLRNLSKRKLYTGINILGLTIAIVSFLAISLYIYHEWSYDRMYAGYERIYKINQDFRMGEDSKLVGTTPSSLIPTILDEIPEVETGTLIFDMSIFSSVLINSGEGNQEESKFAYADQHFFDVFDFQLLHGNANNALLEPNQMVLTESTAKRYFGNAGKAVGKMLKVNDTLEYTITAVVQDFPSNSHLDFDFISSFKTHNHGRNPEWSPSNYFSYIKLRNDATLETIQPKLDQLIDKHLGETQKTYGFQSFLLLQPVKVIHFEMGELRSGKPSTDIKYLYIFGVVALLLILIGIINYVNLATAEATERNKEVGLRKVMGAERMQLFGQFISESFILTLSGMIFSLLILFLLCSFFEAISGVKMQIGLLFSPLGLLMLAAIVVMVALLSGSYPALILAGMEPLKALGKNIKSSGAAWLRKSLVVFQFFVSIGLLISTMVVKQQLDYMQTMNLGYEREQLVALTTNYKMLEMIPAMKKEMVRKGGASSAALAADMPILIKAGYSIQSGGDNMREISITGYAVDHNIVKTLSLELLAGKDFIERDVSRSDGNEKQIDFPLMLNEAALRQLGWSVEEAVGKRVVFGGTIGQVKAVVKDFYFNSLHHQVGPLAIFIDQGQTNLLLVKLTAGNPIAHLANLESIWKEMVPERPFNYKFVDQEYEQLYRSEERVGSIFTLFAGIAIFIACMGLFGLVSYVALRRTREIGIRKVLGATSTDVLKVLTSDFFVLLCISAVMAVGFGLWFSSVWMEGYAYKTELSLAIYPLAILIVAGISLLTIGYRTVKVFLQNPVNALKED